MDEDGKSIFDGAFHSCRPRAVRRAKGGFDYRFAMPTRSVGMLERTHLSEADFLSVVCDTAERHPIPMIGCVRASVARRATRAPVPCRSLLLTSITRRILGTAPAALIATDPSGERDLPVLPRRASITSARRASITSADSASAHLRDLSQPRSTITGCCGADGCLRRWVRDVRGAPPSAYPHISDARW